MPSDQSSTRAVGSRSFLLALGWIGITALLFGVGQLVVHTHAITAYDRQLTNWVVHHRSPALDAAMRAITWIGSWVTVAGTGGVVLVLVLTKRLDFAALLLFAVVWAGDYATVHLVKYAVGRPRPPEDLWLVSAHGASFPSGHAANATLVCAVATAVALVVSRRRSVHAAAVALACVVAAAVPFSRVELGVHWTTDVLAGSAVTLAWSAAIVVLFGAGVSVTVPGPGADQQRIQP